MRKEFYALTTPIGEILIEACGETPTRVILPGSGIKAEAVMEEAPARVKETVEALLAYFEGKDPDPTFARRLLDGVQVSDFGRRVLERVADMPRGSTSSYGEVATMAGNPGAARAIGGVMRSNPFPLIIPCHRVVRSDGGIGGFGGGSGGKTKSWLLEFEGCGITVS